MRTAAGTALGILAVTLATAAPAAAQSPDPQGYCVPENTHHDPTDLARPDARPLELPPGFTRRRITVAGFSTTAIEAGPRDAPEAVVFMHGNPGSSVDFEGILRSVPDGVRVVAIDLIGFGAADKPYDFPYDWEASRPVVDRAFRELGIERMHLVGHDVGAVVGIDWAARHPEQLASAVLIAGGIMIGWQDHHFARIWKTPVVGEQSMRGTDREGFVGMIQLHSPRRLPREFVDRNYDVFDRGTRCAILKIYRSMGDLDALARRHAEALRPYDHPALVIWGDRDVFVPPHVAESSREGFPSADVHVYRNSGHWPFVDEQERTVELMRAFLRRVTAPPELRLTRRCVAGGRLRVALTGDTHEVRDVNFKLDRRLVVRRTGDPFAGTVAARDLQRTSARRLRAVAYVADGAPFRVILARGLPGCGR